METTKEMTVMLQIPLTVRMKALQPADEQAYIDAGMSQCDNDLSDEENRAWFRDMWQQQIRFQELLLSDPSQMANFLRYVAIEKITAAQYFSDDKPFLRAQELEDVAQPIAATLGATEHFFPAASLGVDTWNMLSDLLEATQIDLNGEPAIV